MFKKQDDKMVLEAGWYVQCVSWENDGDYYNTKSKVYPTQEIAEAVVSVVRSYEGANGNRCYSWSGKTESGFVKYDPVQLRIYLEFCNTDQPEIDSIVAAAQRRIDEDEQDGDDELFDAADEWVSNETYDLMGGSESYICRVIDAIMVMNIPTRIEVPILSVQYSARRD